MPTYQELSYIEIHNKRIQPQLWHSSTVVDKLYKIDNIIKEKYNKLYEKYKDNKLRDNTTVRLSPLSILPSYKFKSYIEDNKLNIQIARKASKLNSVIINDTYIRDLFFKKEYTYYVLPINFINKLGKTRSSDNFEADFYIYRPYDDDLDQLKTIRPSAYNEFINYESFNGTLINSGWGSQKAFSCYDYFIDLLDNYETAGYDIIFDHSINDDINKGLYIDDEVFMNLLGMLKSTDEENLKLAQEIVANCEIEISKPYILFLLWKFESFRKIGNNKNFKYCLDTLKPYRNAYISWTNSSLENFLSSIIKEHPEYTQAMFNCIKMYINNEANKDIINNIIVS